VTTKKGGSRSGQQGPATTPLQGALRAVGENNDQAVLLQMLIQQMQAAEQERKLEMAALVSTLRDTQNTFERTSKEWQTQLATIKRDNAQAIDAVREQFQKIIEAKPVDPQTWQQMYQSAMANATKQMAENHAKFLAELETMPTGTVNNDEDKVIQLTINDVPWVFKPGRNRKVPQTFIDMWQQRKALRAWVSNLDLSLQSKAQGTDQSANQLAQVTGRSPVWDTERGRI
jgi:hypothetical protein